MSRIMGLDVGEATVGVAVSDELGFTAQPVTTVRRGTLARDMAAISDLIERHAVTSIVVGMPLRMAGDAGPAARAAVSFVGRLRGAFDLPVVTWDERLTTVQAERLLVEADVTRRRRRDVVNQVAAAILLQSYLDSRRSEAP